MPHDRATIRAQRERIIHDPPVAGSIPREDIARIVKAVVEGEMAMRSRTRYRLVVLDDEEVTL